MNSIPFRAPALVLAVLSILSVSHSLPAAPDELDDVKTGGFLVGSQAWTFNKFTLAEAIDKTRAAGGRVIELFLWQKLSPEHPEVIVNEEMSDDSVALLKRKLDEADVHAVSAYVGGEAFAKYGADEAAFRKLFAFAKKLGLRALTGEPPETDLDIIEKAVKEFDIQFWIHNHQRDNVNPGYKYWNPEYTFGLLANRDTRMGLCLDPNAVPTGFGTTTPPGGASITSGPLYRANPGKYCFPAAYQGGMFYADFTRKWIRYAQVDPGSNSVTNTIPFARGFPGGPLAIQSGPDGAIYVAEYAGWFTGTPHDRLSRIIYEP